MFQLFVNSEGGLTTAGYVLSIVAVIAMVVIALVILNRMNHNFKMTAQQLVICSIAVALAYITSYLRIFNLPYGGSVTLFSMLFIVLIGYWYGVKIGLLTGFVFGILQFLQEPYVLSFFQVCCDYILAYAALGLGGFFSKSKKNGLIKAYVLAIIMRGAFHSLGGYLYWMDYMPEEFPKALTALYPIIYNYSYILAEGILTVFLMSLPPVASALNQVKRIVKSR